LPTVLEAYLGNQAQAFNPFTNEAIQIPIEPRGKTPIGYNLGSKGFSPPQGTRLKTR
jgi:hypothetical protein